MDNQPADRNLDRVHVRVLLFTSSAGRPLTTDHFRQQVLNPILDELGIRAKIQALGVRGGNYGFRHMNATLMDTLNVPMATRQKRLGHADITTTFTHYTKPVDRDDTSASDQIGAIFDPRGSEVLQ